MDRFDDDILAAELRLLRPTPRPEFTAELDERAAAGFPRRSPRAGIDLARLVERLLSPRRMLFPIVGLALSVLVVATIVVLSSGHGSSDLSMSTSGTSMEVSGGAAESAEAGGEEAGEAVLSPHKSAKQKGPLLHAEKSYGVEAGAAGVEEESAPVEEAETEVEGTEHSGEVAPAPSINSQADLNQRDIERSAYVVLGTKPGEVGAASAKVYEAVHAANGIVLHSSVHSGKAGATGATFSLLIPSGKLNDTLAAFSQIAEVRERHDATNDITAPTVSATEELRDSNASIEGLLKELGDVETEAERESVEARLREERRQHAAIRAKLDNLDKRASMSEVSVRIVTSKHSGVTPAGKGSGGGWSIGDALHDAGKVLTVAAGVLLIALAVLAPIALIALLVWSINRFRVRRLRERALG